MSATMRWRTTSDAAEVHERQPLDAGEHPLQAEQPALAVRHVDLGDVAGDDDTRAEADAGEEHLHLLGRRVLRLVEDDEAVVERAAAHERQRGDLDGLALEQALRALGLDHVVQGVVQRAQVRVDLGHQVAGQEAEALAGLDRRAGEDDPLDLLGLQRLDGHRHGQPRLAGAGRADAERDDVLGDGVDVALLAGRLGSDLAALGAAQDVLGEDLARPLVVVDHADHPRAGSARRARGRAAAGRPAPRRGGRPRSDRSPRAVTSLPRTLDLGAREGLLDLAEVLIAGSDERRHEVRARDDDGGRGLGRCHEVGELSALIREMVAARRGVDRCR